jgi:predicted ArsR family transcriptional regulator
MSTNSYPPLRLAVLTGLLDLKQNLGVLDADENPYDKETTAVLKRLLEPEVREKIVEKEVHVEAKAGRGRPSKDIRLSESDQKLITDEINNLIAELKDMGNGETLQTGERIQITKTKANLVDQLLKMRERNSTAQKVEEFMEVVIKILEDYVQEADREQFLRRLEPYR